MKFCQVIKDDKRNYFLQKPFRKQDRETSSRPPFVFQKGLFKAKATGLQLPFNILR